MEKPSFGKSLEEHLNISGREIAFPIEACVTMLLECGMQEEVDAQIRHTGFLVQAHIARQQRRVLFTTYSMSAVIYIKMMATLRPSPRPVAQTYITCNCTFHPPVAMWTEV